MGDLEMLEIAHHLARRRLRIFAAFRQFGHHDLMMEAWLAMKLAGPRMQTRKLMWMVGDRRLISIWRISQASSHREAVMAIDHSGRFKPLPDRPYFVNRTADWFQDFLMAAAPKETQEMLAREFDRGVRSHG